MRRQPLIESRQRGQRLARLAGGHRVRANAASRLFQRALGSGPVGVRHGLIHDQEDAAVQFQSVEHIARSLQQSPAAIDRIPGRLRLNDAAHIGSVVVDRRRVDSRPVPHIAQTTLRGKHRGRSPAGGVNDVRDRVLDLVVGMNSVIRQRIERLPRGLQRFDASAPIALGQHRSDLGAACLGRRVALHDRRRASFQGDDESAVGQRRPVLGVQPHAAAGCDDHMLASRGLLNRPSLQLAEPAFAVCLKDLGDRSSCGSLDLIVQIYRFPTEPVGHEWSQYRLSGRAEADQHNALERVWQGHFHSPLGTVVSRKVSILRRVSESVSPPNFSSIASASTRANIASTITPAAGTTQTSERSK